MIPIRNTTPIDRTPVVTGILIAANIAVFLYALSLSGSDLMAFFFTFGIVPARLLTLLPGSYNGITNAAVGPLLTSMFIHGDFFHIFFNVWTLRLFGPQIEDRMGRGRYLLFFLATGICSGAIHAFVNPHSTIPTVGASGAIAGILGAYFVLLPLSRITILLPILIFPFFFDVPAFLYLFIWFFSQVHSGAWALIGSAPRHGGVAFWAHIGGFLSGIYLLSVLAPNKRRR
ncbi:rhomboid family intramembrane serine protease [bacterium]|nr:rhomboid family intramembrane serine protease [candidate division CSSED10-310 bacterium]